MTPRDVEQERFYHLCHGAWDLPDLRRMLEEVLPKTAAFQDLVLDKTFPRIGRKVFALNGRRLEQDAAQPDRILVAMEEVRGPSEKAAE